MSPPPPRDLRTPAVYFAALILAAGAFAAASLGLIDVLTHTATADWPVVEAEVESVSSYGATFRFVGPDGMERSVTDHGRWRVPLASSAFPYVRRTQTISVRHEPKNAWKAVLDRPLPTAVVVWLAGFTGLGLFFGYVAYREVRPAADV